jgi:hypothetical protein
MINATKAATAPALPAWASSIAFANHLPRLVETKLKLAMLPLAFDLDAHQRVLPQPLLPVNAPVHERVGLGQDVLERVDRERLPVVERHLDNGVLLGVRGVSGFCADILKHREALWTFAHVPGVEPANNHAERELRAFVMWRRRSFGSQSERGCRFAERIMTVTHTLRKQKRHVLAYLTEACQAAQRRKTTPSLVITNP